ncbi:hypothetical protein B0H16DRAFT_1321453, partial [Mycena metata]
MVLWILNSLSPQEIRDRIMQPDSAFQTKLVHYLESCHRAEFSMGSLSDVEAHFNLNLKAESKWEGIRNYMPPTHTLPTCPPRPCRDIGCKETCTRCVQFATWWKSFIIDTDDLALRTNVHSHLYSVDDEELDRKKRDWRRKGCMTSKGVCKARFPRKVFPSTVVEDDGHVNTKHLEPMVNRYNPLLTYLSRCNTDVTSLMSGTAVKAVVAYVSDYISKVSLKSYQLFASVFQVFENNATSDHEDEKVHDKSRHMMRQMVNSLSTKMEIGSPMAAMYLLGDLDHYSSHNFVPFAWRSYAFFVRKFWHVEDVADNEEKVLDEKVELTSAEGIIIAGSAVDDYRYRPHIFENVSLYEWVQCSVKSCRSKKERKEFEAYLASLETHQPGTPTGLSAYPTREDDDFDEDSDDEYLVSADEDTFDLDNEILSDTDWDTDDDDETVDRKQAKHDKSRSAKSYPYLRAHPRFLSHHVSCDFSRLHSMIPNFIGGALPRADKGDRSFYCLTILTLFKPWRSPAHLKAPDYSWSQAFSEYSFTARQLNLMSNFNVRYECNDARDDHYAEMQRRLREESKLHQDSVHPRLGVRDDVSSDMDPILYNLSDEDDDGSEDDDDYIGPISKRLKEQEVDMVSLLRSSGWLRRDFVGRLDVTPAFDRVVAPPHSRATWANIVKGERQKFTANKLTNLPVGSPSGNKVRVKWDQVEVLEPEYLYSAPPGAKASAEDMQKSIISDFKLNQEQERAFRLLADHAS